MLGSFEVLSAIRAEKDSNSCYILSTFATTHPPAKCDPSLPSTHPLSDTPHRSPLLTSLGLQALPPSSPPPPYLAGTFLISNFVLSYLVLAPRSLKQYYGFDHNSAPREDISKYGEKMVSDGKLSRSALKRIKRMEAAQANSIENLPLLVAGVLYAMHKAVDSRTVNALMLGYTVARVAYAIAYVLYNIISSPPFPPPPPPPPPPDRMMTPQRLPPSTHPTVLSSSTTPRPDHASDQRPIVFHLLHDKLVRRFGELSESDMGKEDQLMVLCTDEGAGAAVQDRTVTLPKNEEMFVGWSLSISIMQFSTLRKAVAFAGAAVSVTTALNVRQDFSEVGNITFCANTQFGPPCTYYTQPKGACYDIGKSDTAVFSNAISSLNTNGGGNCKFYPVGNCAGASFYNTDYDNDLTDGGGAYNDIIASWLC
ncbi:hypothetical protein B7494_g8369 [Chlorociboria aeruginascens]|nr:hypothetical protein B7494_g8369 [Chlorociboria aeruginascens]